MKKLLYIILLLPLWVNAQTNGTIQKTSATGTIRGSFGSLGLDTLTRVTGALVNGYILKYNSSTNKWYASPDIAETLGTSAISLGGTANGLSYSAGNYRLHKVNATNGGVLTTGLDTISGIKRFINTPLFNSTYALGQATFGSTGQGAKINLIEGGSGNANGVLGYNSATSGVLTLTNLGQIEISSTNTSGILGLRATGISGRLQFRTGATQNAEVFSTGNWLLQQGGTFTDAGYKLDVAGTGRFTSALTANSFVKTGGTGAQFLMGNGSTQDTTQIQTVSNFFPKGDTRYPRLTGGGASGLWGISITGNAETSTNAGNSILWQGYSLNTTPISSGVTHAMVWDGTGFRLGTSAGVGSFLGLGTNAFNSTAFLPLTGGTVAGLLETSVNSTNNFTITGITHSGGNYVSVDLKRTGGSVNAQIVSTSEVANDRANFRINTRGSGGLLERFRISSEGLATIADLAGSGTRMVVANNLGDLSTQAIPSGGGGGTVSSVSVNSANGFAGTSSGGSNPALNISTTVNGILYGDGSSVSTAVAANFPTLNQNTTGNAATATNATNATLWQGLGLNTTPISSGVTHAMVYNGTEFRLGTNTGLATFLGLGSNAYTSTSYAPLASPAFTGTPTAPTQTAGDNSTKIATTAYVDKFNLTSGTYTPTLSNGTNVAGSTMLQAQYMRVGNTVTVSGQLMIQPNLPTSDTSFLLTLPVASDITLSQNIGGSGAVFESVVDALFIQGDATNDKVSFVFRNTGASNYPVSYTYTYLIQ